MNKFSLSVNIPVSRYLLDHRLEGRAVFPAVEAVQLICKTVQDVLPETDITRIYRANFYKFLYLREEEKFVLAIVEVKYAEEKVCTSLCTRTKISGASFTRIKEHASLEFAGKDSDDSAQLPEGIDSSEAFRVTAKDLYRELVPFKSAFHNALGELHLTGKGVSARVYAPQYNTIPGPLGSPFPLDAAFHAACAWSQRYMGIVAFPVGFFQRTVYIPTLEKEIYNAEIRFTGIDFKDIVFELWIGDEKQRVRERVSKLKMRDISAGRMLPPKWILA